MEASTEGGDAVREPDDAAALGPGAADAVIAHSEPNRAVLDAYGHLDPVRA